MDIKEVVEGSLTVVLLVFGLLLAVSLVALLIRRSRGRSIRQQFPHPMRSAAIRLGIALAAGVSVFVLVSASLVLNSHRPPADINPIVRVPDFKGPVTVDLTLPECGAPVQGRVTLSGGRVPEATIYSDGDGLRTIEFNRRGQATFELTKATAKRGLLSCFLQLPEIDNGGGPSTVRLEVDDEMEVDTVASVPAPAAYSRGKWIWKCPPGERCPSLAIAGFAVEDGAKQVIVLVLAALFGAIMALFIGEALIEPLRRRLDRRGPD